MGKYLPRIGESVRRCWWSVCCWFCFLISAISPFLSSWVSNILSPIFVESFPNNFISIRKQLQWDSLLSGVWGNSIVISPWSQGSLYVRRKLRKQTNIEDDDSSLQSFCPEGWHESNQKHLHASIECHCKPCLFVRYAWWDFRLTNRKNMTKCKCCW